MQLLNNQKSQTPFKTRSTFILLTNEFWKSVLKNKVFKISFFTLLCKTNKTNFIWMNVSWIRNSVKRNHYKKQYNNGERHILTRPFLGAGFHNKTVWITWFFQNHLFLFKLSLNIRDITDIYQNILRHRWILITKATCQDNSGMK